MTSTNASLISDEYEAELKGLVAEKPQWGSTAYRHAQRVADICKSVDADSLLDYGCGTGSLRQTVVRERLLRDTEIHEYDPSRVGKNLPAGNVQFDVVACIDVMEHVEPDKIDAVLAHIKSLTGRTAYFLIACRKAVHTLPSGKNAHLVVRPTQWWLGRLAAHFGSVELERDLASRFTCVCKP